MGETISTADPYTGQFNYCAKIVLRLQDFSDDDNLISLHKTDRDPLDEYMTHHFSTMTSKLVGRFGQVETLHDFELASNRRPRILVQSAGHVSGAVRFYRFA